jgi:hypothetical protein
MIVSGMLCHVKLLPPSRRLLCCQVGQGTLSDDHVDHCISVTLKLSLNLMKPWSVKCDAISSAGVELSLMKRRISR